MAQLVIKEEELKQLDTIIGEVPTKIGIQLINFFNSVGQKRQQEAQAEQQRLAADSAKIPATNGTADAIPAEAN